MKSQSIIYLLIVVVVIITLTYSCFHSSVNTSNSSAKKADLSYEAQILEKRKEVEAFLISSEDSPIQDKKRFKGLNYYKPNEKYKVKAQFLDIKKKSTLLMQTSTGESQSYIKYAYAQFELDGVVCRLLLLKKNLRDPRAFIAFTDLTSGRETYGAGRYIDMPILGKRKDIVIDFNLAYNPYCAYNHKYSCPIPPEENNLNVAIKAGEKVYD